MNRMAALRFFTKEKPDVRRRFRYPYENNMAVVRQINKPQARIVKAVRAWGSFVEDGKSGSA